MKGIIFETKQIIANFFKSYGLKDEKMRIPLNVKRMGSKIAIINLMMTILSLAFAFLLKISNMMIECKMIMLGILLFMLYRGQLIVRATFRLFEESEKEKFEFIFKNEIILRAGEIFGMTKNKVLKYDEKEKIYKLIPDESINNTLKNYLSSYWSLCIHHKFDALELLSTILMLVIAILTNTGIPQGLFIPMILIFACFSFISSAYITMKRKEYYKKDKECKNEQTIVVNDLLRVPSIVNNDFEMRIEKLKNSFAISNENVLKFNFKLKISRLIDTILETLSQYGVIILYLFNVDWNSINLSTITEITATLAIVETSLGYISKIAYNLNRHNEKLTIINEEKKDLLLILEVYNMVKDKNLKPQMVTNLKITPFSIKYLEESQNDKPFTLVSQDEININNGEVVILYGPSGSGKSTFMKILTEKIRIEKSTEIPTTSRFLFYDETLRFGSLSIFEEIFCCNETPDLEKMQNILENLHLWPEIKSNCFDVWQWMKEKKFGHALSNGQKQRLILAKMLYWLNNDIDVIVLDECTSGLDDKTEGDSADAQKILEFLIRYCNNDKKRIIILSTHQNIDEVKGNLYNEYIFRNMNFVSGNDSNYIKEIL